MDLDEEIQRLKQIAASQELLSLFVKHNGLSTLVPLLQHANTDLAGGVVDVLAELTSPESILDLEDPLSFGKMLVS